MGVAVVFVVNELVLWSVLCDEEQMVVTIAGECNQKVGLGFFDDMFASGPYAEDDIDVPQPIDNPFLKDEKTQGLIGDDELIGDDVGDDSKFGVLVEQSNTGGAASSSAALPPMFAGDSFRVAGLGSDQVVFHCGEFHKWWRLITTRRCCAKHSLPFVSALANEVMEKIVRSFDLAFFRIHTDMRF